MQENPYTPDPQRSKLPQLKDGDGWFRLPNSFVDLYARELGARGVMCYVHLARAHTRMHYPGLEDLMYYLTTSRARVLSILAKLKEFNLINDWDLEGILGAEGEGRSSEGSEE